MMNGQDGPRRPLTRRAVLRWAAAPALVHSAGLRAVESPLVVGMTASLGSPVGQALYQGLAAALAQADDRGARKVQLMALDDAGQPEQAAAHARKLLAARPVCFTSCQGSPCGLAVSAELNTGHVPMVGVSSGAEKLRADSHRQLFHTRATRRDEASAIVFQLDALGITRIAVMHSTDEFGLEGLEGARVELVRVAIRPVAVQPLDAGGAEADAAVARIKATAPEVIVAAMPDAALVETVRAVRRAQMHCRVIALSENDHAAVARSLGATARGLGFSQVLPFVGREAVPVVRDFHAAMKAVNATAPASYAGLEGYINGRAIIELLRRGPRGADSILALQKPVTLDIGGHRLAWAPNERRGTSFVEMSVMDAAGRLRV